MNSIVLFGVTGDLSRAKLIPSLARLWTDGLFEQGIGFVRKDFSKEDFEKYIAEYSASVFGSSVEQNLSGQIPDSSVAKNFASKWSYVCSGIDNIDGYKNLADTIGQSEVLFYVALPPQYQMTVANMLVSSGLLSKNTKNRIAFEKPFGYDAPSALLLNNFLLEHLLEENIFRVDHYAGKEAVLALDGLGKQGLLTETYNSKNFSKIEVRLHEKKDVKGRGAFYDAVGALSDVGQNHLLYVLSSVLAAPFFVGRKVENNAEAQDEGVQSFSTENISIEKMRHIALDTVDFDVSVDTVEVGQYAGFLSEDGVKLDSTTETYFKIRGKICDNENFVCYLGDRACTENEANFKKDFIARWKGLEIEISAGKAMKENDVAVYLYSKVLEQGQELGLGQSSVTMISINSQDTNKPQKEAYDEVFRSALAGDKTRFMDIEQVLIGWRLVEDVKKLHKKPFIY